MRFSSPKLLANHLRAIAETLLGMIVYSAGKIVIPFIYIHGCVTYVNVYIKYNQK
ncbi:hypothetical protein TNCT_216221, partial [Trichonephila clavata]